MAIESACTPMPSEIVMPFGGFAVQRGDLNFWLVVLAGTFGCLAGSLFAYGVGYYGGRPILEKYGRYIMITKDDIDRADRWFSHYGTSIVFFARLLPLVRAVISLPAGIAEMDLKKFIVYSFAGSIPYCLVLTYLGVIMGNNWDTIENYYVYVDIVMVVGIVAVIAYLGYKMFKRNDALKTAPKVKE
jgi:membrane protein DedA with SNARE-associated domain